MGNSVNTIESKLQATIEDSVFEILIHNIMHDLKAILNAKSSNDNEIVKKQKILIKVLLDAKNEMLCESKKQIVSKN